MSQKETMEEFVVMCQWDVDDNYCEPGLPWDFADLSVCLPVDTGRAHDFERHFLYRDIINPQS